MMHHVVNHTNPMCDCVIRETLDHRDPQVKMVPLVFEASPESEVYLVPQ